MDFSRRAPKPTVKEKKSKGGIANGRKNHHQLHNHYAKKKGLSDKSSIAVKNHIEKIIGKSITNRFKSLFRASHIVLYLVGMTTVATEYPVVLDMETHCIETRVDLVGVSKRKIVAVEIKYTTKSIARFEQLYDINCGVSTMANFSPDTERTHHHLQAALGVLGVRARLPAEFRSSVVGLIIVCGTDKVKSYSLDERFLDKRFFKPVPNNQKFRSSSRYNADIMKMPENDAYHGKILAVLQKYNVSRITAINVGVSFVAKTRSGSTVVVSIVNDVNEKRTATAKYKKARAQTIDVGKRCKAASAFVLFHTNGNFFPLLVRMPK